MFFLAMALMDSPVRLVRSDFIYDKAPFPSCHAATIVQTRTGAILAAWFGGTAESNPDVKVYLSQRVGESWTPPREVAAGHSAVGEPRPCYNPVLFQPRKGPLMLFYKVGTGPQTWWGMMKTSVDDGQTWGQERQLPDGIFGPIKNKPVELSDGTILCPSSTEDQGWRVHFESTKDGGKTWTRTGPLNDGKQIGAIQPSLLRLSKTKLRAVGRSQQGSVFAIDSSDNGQTWGAMRLLNIPNPNSGIDAITLRDGRHLMVYNNTPQGRTPLNMAISKDGETWNPVLTLEDQPGEYSYPSIIQAKNGRIFVVYTWHRTHIKVAEIALR